MFSQLPNVFDYLSKFDQPMNELFVLLSICLLELYIALHKRIPTIRFHSIYQSVNCFVRKSISRILFSNTSGYNRVGLTRKLKSKIDAV